jgi:hypothetical protein
MRYWADDIASQNCSAEVEPGKWAAARPINYTCDSWWARIKDAWAVLTGRADAVFWHKQ